jgi:hypothetical protein
VAIEVQNGNCVLGAGLVAGDVLEQRLGVGRRGIAIEVRAAGIGVGRPSTFDETVRRRPKGNVSQQDMGVGLDLEEGG